MFKTIKKEIIGLMLMLGLLTSFLNASVPNAPGPYIGVTLLTPTSVRINFVDNSDNEEGFIATITDRSPIILPPNDENLHPQVYQDFEGLECNKTYIIIISAFNSDGNSSVAKGAFNMHSTFGLECNRTDVPKAPGAYIGVTLIDKTSVRINFLDNSNNETGFRVFGDINLSILSNPAPASTQVYQNIGNLVCDKLYKIQAVAYNNSGDSLPSNERYFNIKTTFSGVDCNNSNKAPIIQLNGSSIVTVAKGLPYVEQGATANDPEDGDITANIVVSGVVNTDVMGDHNVTYTVVDSDGLQAEIVRTVRVVFWHINNNFDEVNIDTEHNVRTIGLDRTNGTLKLVSGGETTFPFIWVANSGEGTISLLSTDTGNELGRYKTSPSNGNPSRTTVDLDGSVWVGNRNSNTITKIGLKELNQCVDRNNNGTIETSTGGADVKAWANGGVGIANAEDECILQHVVLSQNGLSAQAVRLVAVDTDNNVFAGGSSSTALFKVNGATGAIMNAVSTLQNHYGGVIDKNGNIWSMPRSHNGTVQKISADMNSKENIQIGHGGYGVTIDKYGKVWTTEYGRRFSCFNPTNPVGTLQVFHQTNHSGGQGITSDSNGDIFIAGSLNRSSVGQYKQTFDVDGNFTGIEFVKNHTVQSGPTGVAVDAKGKVWASNYYSNSVSRIDPVTEVVEHFAVGKRPYNYSDMTGNVIRNILKRGTWEGTFDSQDDTYRWNNVKWRLKEVLPANTTLKVSARVANSEIALAGELYAEIQNGVALNLTGRYLEVKVELISEDSAVTPELVEIELY